MIADRAATTLHTKRARPSSVNDIIDESISSIAIASMMIEHVCSSCLAFELVVPVMFLQM